MFEIVGVNKIPKESWDISAPRYSLIWLLLVVEQSVYRWVRKDPAPPMPPKCMPQTAAEQKPWRPRHGNVSCLAKEISKSKKGTLLLNIYSDWDRFSCECCLCLPFCEVDVEESPSVRGLSTKEKRTAKSPNWAVFVQRRWDTLPETNIAPENGWFED